MLRIQYERQLRRLSREELAADPQVRTTAAIIQLLESGEASFARNLDGILMGRIAAKLDTPVDELLGPAPTAPTVERVGFSVQEALVRSLMRFGGGLGQDPRPQDLPRPIQKQAAGMGACVLRQARATKAHHGMGPQFEFGRTSTARTAVVKRAKPGEALDVRVLGHNAKRGFTLMRVQAAGDESDVWAFLQKDRPVVLTKNRYTIAHGLIVENQLYRADEEWDIGGEVIKSGDWLLGVQWPADDTTWAALQAAGRDLRLQEVGA